MFLAAIAKVVPAVAPVAATVVSTLGPDTAAVVNGIVWSSANLTRTTDLPMLGLEKPRHLSVT